MRGELTGSRRLPARRAWDRFGTGGLLGGGSWLLGDLVTRRLVRWIGPLGGLGLTRPRRWLLCSCYQSCRGEASEGAERDTMESIFKLHNKHLG